LGPPFERDRRRFRKASGSQGGPQGDGVSTILAKGSPQSDDGPGRPDTKLSAAIAG